MAEGPAENNKPSAEMGEQTAVQGSMKPLQNNEMEEHRKTPPQTETQTTVEQGETLMANSLHGRSCSLPRQKKLGDSSPSPIVAIVSPMPSLTRGQTMATEQEPTNTTATNNTSQDKLSSGNDKQSETLTNKEETEDPLLGIAPMTPLGLFTGLNQQGQGTRINFSRGRNSQEYQQNIQTVNTATIFTGKKADSSYS